MSTTTTSTNRGPAAAAGNRQALLDAARRLFAERGYHVPLSAIAREAGVGQGSLYRHFPTRLDLALAIFEENFAQLEALADNGAGTATATDSGSGDFLQLWRQLLELLLSSTAFIELVVDRRHEVDGARFGQRLRQVLAGPLARAQADGAVARDLTVDDLTLVLRMVYGAVVTETDVAAARAAARRTLRMVDPTLDLDHQQERT